MRFAISFAIILCSFSLFAGPVSVERASNVALNLFGKNTQKSTSTVELKYTGIADGDTLYYVFSYADGGFSIISADDAVVPVLGYSATSDAGEVAENKSLLFQLDRYGQAISEARKIDGASLSVQRQWQAFAMGQSNVNENVVEVGPLVTSRWGQEGYYNDSCPSYVGCMAVAMGQVMRFHNWPKQGRGWHEYIPTDEPERGPQFANFGATTYRWDLMHDKLRDNHTDAEKSAVAQLLYHAGVSVNMSYTEEGSGSYSCDVLPALVNYFFYSKDLKLCSYSNYSVKDWFALISGEIDAGRPVIYSGATKKQEGHAWVVDGYNSEGYLHVNWGWDGDYDGYFYVENMILGTTVFSEEIDAIVGIEPDVNAPVLWTMQSSGFRDYCGINNISVVDSKTAWASAFDGFGQNKSCMYFCRTTNGGEYWQSGRVKFSGYQNYSISMICAISDKEAWAPVYVSSNSRTLTGGKIAHTTDGGETWEIQKSATFDGADAFPNVVHFWDVNNGVCLGDPNNGYFEIYTTTDGGENWNRVSSSRIPANQKDETGVVGCYCVCGDTVFFSTTTGRLFRSVDRGATWTATQTPMSSYFGVAFRNGQCGVIKDKGEDSFSAYRTTDGGESWQEIADSTNFYSSALSYIPETDTLLSVGIYPNSGISYSVDDGATFTNFADFYSDIDSYTALGVSPDGKSVWVGAYNFSLYYGGMWHRGLMDVDRHSITSISEKMAVATTDVSIYPNPTDGMLFVESKTEIVQIDVLSVMGTRVKSLTVNACKTSVNLQDLPNGVYVLRINTKFASISKQIIIN